LGVRLLRDGKDCGLEFSAYLAHCFVRMTVLISTVVKRIRRGES
jgi:hypothetical protein